MDKRKFLIGTLLIIAGVIIAGYNLELIDINLFFDGWWTLLIIIPSLFGLFKKNTFEISCFGLIFGGAFLLQEQLLIRSAWDVFLPAILLTIGFSILFNSGKKKVKADKKYKSTFTVLTQKEDLSDINNLEVNAIIGGINLDLTDAKLKEDVNIKVESVMGGIEIKVPTNVNLDIIYNKLIIGDCKNKTENVNKEKQKTIHLEVNAILGDVTILN